jgi:4-hydroxybutyrate CoA-transferase
MDWKEIYKSRLVSAQDAVKHIKSGDRVVFGHSVAEPTALVEAMVENKAAYENVEIVHMVAMGKGDYAQPGMEKHFRHNAFFVGGSTRQPVSEGRADYTPCFFYKVPSMFKEGYLPVDVLMTQVSPPDEHGYCTLGTSVDYTKAALDCAKIVIVQVNDQMPRTMGDSFVHVSDIDFFVEESRVLVELKPPVITDVEKAIGENCAKLVEDGSTLQLGIGAIPDAVLLFLKDKKDLGIHSEMFSDGVVELVESGVITNKMKSIHKGKMIVTFLMGTKRLYDFINGNPTVEMYPVDYVNNPAVIMQNYKMVSINSCVQVDLMGQVASETTGGKSIIAMMSTASNNKISRIVPLLDEGAAVTTSRNDVHYIVTEYGIADLRGKTLKDRGRALIGIAHPIFREQLIAVWEDRFKTKF